MANRLGEEEHESQDRWLVSYADFITLLFAFFTVLYATSERNQEKTKEFQESVRRYLIKGGALGGSADTVNQSEKFSTPIEQPIPTYPQSVSRKAEQTETDLVMKIESLLSQEDIRKTIIDISAEDVGVRVSVFARGVFLPNSSQLDPQKTKQIAKLGQIFSGLKSKLIIEGHTSNMSNSWELASSRASQFVKYLNAVQRVPADQLAAVSFGHQRPLIPIDQPDPSFKNDRLDVIVLTDDFPF